MKNVNSFLQRVSGILFALFCLSFGLNSQILQVTETPPTDLNVCMGGYPFSVTVLNTSTTVTASNIKLFYDMPDGMAYTGVVSNATYFGTNPPDQPIFALADLLPGASVTVTFEARADCSLFALASTNVNISNDLHIGYTETPGAAQNEAVTTASYNLFTASLSISVTNESFILPDPFDNAQIGNSFAYPSPNPFRQITISNLGGSTDTVLIHIKAENEIQYFGFTAFNGMPLNDWWFDMAAQEYILRITGVDFDKVVPNPKSSPLLFEDGETLIIYEDFDVIACSSTPNQNTDYFVEWGCEGQICQNTSNQEASKNVTVNAGSPVISPSLDGGYPVTSYCRDGDRMFFKYTNTAVGAANFATDVVLMLQSYDDFATPSFTLYDFEINGFPVPASMVQEVFNMPTIGSIPPGAKHGYVIDLTNNTIPNFASDLDFDGFRDDLGAGQVLRLSAKIRFDNPENISATCPMDYFLMAGRPQARWNATCSNTSKEATNAQDQFYLYSIRPNGAFNGTIAGTSDMVENQAETFTFCTGSFQISEEFFDCPVDSIFAYIFLPDGYGLVGNDATFTNSLNITVPLSAYTTGDTVVIPYDKNEGWQGCYTLDLELRCDLVQNNLFGTSELSWELNYKCDTCDIMQRRVCDSKTLYNHADCNSDVLTCDGVATTGFDFQRKSFGWLNYNSSVKANETTAGINLNAAYPYDTVQSVTNGRVVGDSTTSVFCEIRYQAKEIMFDWMSGRVEVYDLSGNLVTSCPIASAPTPTVTVIATGTNALNEYNYLFDVPSACKAALDSGYTVKFFNDWQVKNVASLAFKSVFFFDLLRSTFLFGSNLSHCDEWGSNFAIYEVRSNPYPQVLNSDGCEPYHIALYLDHNGGIGGDDFPNEIRPPVQLNDTVVIHIPEGSTYIDGSAFTVHINSYDPITNICDCDTNYLTPFSQNADSLVFIYDWQLIDKFAKDNTGKIPAPYLQTSFQPECDRNDTTYTLVDFNYELYAYTQNAGYYSHKDWTDAPKIDNSNNVRLYNYLPNLTISTGTFIVDAYTKTAQWTVQVCNRVSGNLPKVTDAVYTWFDIDNYASNIGNITIDRVYETTTGTDQTVINYFEAPDENTLVLLGSTRAGTCRSYTLEGSYVNCAPRNDSLNLVLGWNCTGYPDPLDAETASCKISESLLGVRYKTAQMNTTVFAPTGTFEVCDTLHYEILLESTLPGFMYDVKYWTNLPNGSSMINADYLYPLKSNVWRDLDLTNTAFSGVNPIGWDLSNTVPEWIYHDGGFFGTKEPDSSKIRLRFDIALNCDYNPADSIVFNSFGITNCQDTLEFRQVKRILINGFTALDKLNVSMTMPDTLQCGETGRIDITVTNTNNVPNQFEDSLRVEIPNIFGVLGTSPFGASTQNGTATAVKWNIAPLSLAGDSSTVYTIFVIGNNVTECTEIEIPSTVYYVGSANCGLTVCNPTATIDVADSSVILCCNPCLVNAEFEADTVCYSACCGGADTTCFKLADLSNIGADYVHFWDFGDGFTSTDAEPCHIYDTVGVYFACHTVTQLSTGCFETFCDSVRVIDKPSGAIELLGCNPFCEGDTVYLTVNGTYTSIEWVMLPSGITVGTNDTLTVTTGGRYNAILSNGICTSECLAIDIQTQLSPEIGIPDTAFCLGDSILICAGGGFTSYEWQKDGTVINSVDSCIYISSPGQYTVTVGEKLPFGCCTCKGVDTFNVIINTIAVTVPDLTICEGQNGTLCATSTGGYAPYTYVWQPNGEITPCITVNSSGEYIATVTDAMGCTAVDTGTVTIDLPPNAEFIFDDTICVNLEYCYVPIENAGTHYWEVADSNGLVIATSAANPFCYLFPFVGTFSVTHILTNNCGADTVTHIIEVMPPIEACIVLIGSNPFCVGDTVCLTTNDPFNQITQVEWYLNDVLVFVGDMLCVTEPGTYRAVVTDINGCVSECMCIVLTQIPAPIVNLPDNLTICEGQNNMVLDAGLGYSTYVWFRNNQFLAYGVSTITVTTAGTYRVEVTGTNGCKAVDSTIVSIAPQAIIVGSSLQTVCRNQPVTVFTACNPNYTYQWSLSANGTNTGTPIPNSDTCRLTLTGNDLLNGNNWFHLMVLDNSTGCILRARIRVIHRLNNCNEISLYPNPVLDNSVSMIYDLMDAGVQDATIQFRNIMGAVVATYSTDPEIQETILDVTNLANGVYHVSLIADGVIIDTQQLVIAR